MYPRERLDSFSDAIFAVAMTLLVLDVRLPDDFTPTSDTDLVRALMALAPKFLPYVISFVVLGYRWLSNVSLRARGEMMSRAYVNYWLVYLLLITCVPLTTIVVGRFSAFAPAIWLYAGNAVLISVISFRLIALTPEIERTDHLRERQISLVLLIASGIAAILWSFLSPRHALWFLLLNVAAPWVHRWTRGGD